MSMWWKFKQARIQPSFGSDRGGSAILVDTHLRSGEIIGFLKVLSRYVGNGFQLALCSVGWLTTREFVIPGPDPIVFPPWLVLLDLGERRVICQDPSHEAACRGQARVTSTGNRLQA